MKRITTGPAVSAPSNTFQRARLEYYPEHAGTPQAVQLGALGDELLWQRGWLLE